MGVRTIPTIYNAALLRVSVKNTLLTVYRFPTLAPLEPCSNDSFVAMLLLKLKETPQNSSDTIFEFPQTWMVLYYKKK